MSTVKKTEIHIRRVFSFNLETEFNLIRQCVNEGFHFAALDTEFPGVIYRPACHHRCLSQSQSYAFVKANVDALQIIQIGISLSDAEGNLPDFGITGSGFIWEFNFCDFDLSLDSCVPESIDMLYNNGINFHINKIAGIESCKFAKLLISSGLILNGSSVSWVGFHSIYDFGYMIKILTRQSLPATRFEFLAMVWKIFGGRVFDVKHMIRYCDGLHGGLERVAEILEVERSAGMCHQAGSDSLLTLQVFLKLKKGVFAKKGVDKFAGVIHGM